MIAPPARVTSTPRGTSPSLVTGADGGDGDNLGAQASLDARIAALVARAKTPEDEALERQRQEFDFIARVQAEAERETDVLRDLAMEQMKHDDELLKKWIALI